MWHLKRPWIPVHQNDASHIHVRIWLPSLHRLPIMKPWRYAVSIPVATNVSPMAFTPIQCSAISFMLVRAVHDEPFNADKQPPMASTTVFQRLTWTPRAASNSPLIHAQHCSTIKSSLFCPSCSNHPQSHRVAVKDSSPCRIWRHSTATCSLGVPKDMERPKCSNVFHHCQALMPVAFDMSRRSCTSRSTCPRARHSSPYNTSVLAMTLRPKIVSISKRKQFSLTSTMLENGYIALGVDFQTSFACPIGTTGFYSNPNYCDVFHYCYETGELSSFVCASMPNRYQLWWSHQNEQGRPDVSPAKREWWSVSFAISFQNVYCDWPCNLQGAYACPAHKSNLMRDRQPVGNVAQQEVIEATCSSAQVPTVVGIVNNITPEPVGFVNPTFHPGFSPGLNIPQQQPNIPQQPLPPPGKIEEESSESHIDAFQRFHRFSVINHVRHPTSGLSAHRAFDAVLRFRRRVSLRIQRIARNTTHAILTWVPTACHQVSWCSAWLVYGGINNVVPVYFPRKWLAIRTISLILRDKVVISITTLTVQFIPVVNERKNECRSFSDPSLL